MEEDLGVQPRSRSVDHFAAVTGTLDSKTAAEVRTQVDIQSLMALPVFTFHPVDFASFKRQTPHVFLLSFAEVFTYFH